MAPDVILVMEEKDGLIHEEDIKITKKIKIVQFSKSCSNWSKTIRSDGKEKLNNKEDTDTKM